MRRTEWLLVLLACFRAIASAQAEQDAPPPLTAPKETVVVVGKIVEPTVDLRNSEVFERTLFTRDDQVLQQLNAMFQMDTHDGFVFSIWYGVFDRRDRTA